ncbi:heterokaryon incompatibility protein-domain-containing protein [Podospora fimiseda]|uniref:Heterokaryon incompatibility protein-domain-containing protein n=1 Tax=Podospora fimiseda TaxID=252190 RepID=A0AAN7H1A7_9PEZI|nr:heterokaryon incompatibility protein-domain-containing protein [Podospora fimiseda]
MSSSVPPDDENPGLCRACRAMLNSQYPDNFLDAGSNRSGNSFRQIKEFESLEASNFNQLDLFPASIASSLVNHDQVESNTNSDATWKLIADWMDRCTNTHELLPTRVIDLRADTARLLVVDTTTPILPYATLSHCWGSHIPLRLTLDNFSQLQKEIPSKDLSKTFLDAFTIARRLGLKYIWIDSLCIIQQGPESYSDWETESSRMVQVYTNSYCNIAAAHAADGTQGCFIERDPKLVRPLRVEVNWGPTPGPHYAVRENYWLREVSLQCLNRRAWAFQERCLAPRNVIFGENQVFWECKELAANETFPMGLPSGIWAPKSTLLPHVDGAYFRKIIGLSHAPELDAFSMWGTIHLASQLLWSTDGWKDPDFVPPLSASEENRIPSWSWASLHTGAVTSGLATVLFEDERDIVIDVLDAQVDLVNPKHPFGQVNGGFLRVRGYLAMSGLTIERQAHDVTGSFKIAYMDHPDEHANSTTEPNPYYFLPIRYIKTPLSAEEFGLKVNIPTISGIILRPVHPDIENEFVRVGQFDVYRDQNAEIFRNACERYTRERVQKKKLSGLSLGEWEESEDKFEGIEVDDWGAKWEITIY